MIVTPKALKTPKPSKCSVDFPFCGFHHLQLNSMFGETLVEFDRLKGCSIHGRG